MVDTHLVFGLVVGILRHLNVKFVVLWVEFDARFQDAIRFIELLQLSISDTEEEVALSTIIRVLLEQCLKGLSALFELFHLEQRVAQQELCFDIVIKGLKDLHCHLEITILHQLLTVS